MTQATHNSRITAEPGKCGGRPCVRGKRIRVSDVQDLLAAGADEQEILRDYPFLDAADIRACQAPMTVWPPSSPSSTTWWRAFILSA